MEINEFPIVSRPLEYLALSIYVIPTLLDGNAYFYFVIDAYNGIATQIGIDRNDQSQTIIKHIYLLTENSDIIQNKEKGFTLVLEEYEELYEPINAIINGVNGKILIDKSYHNNISIPVLKNLREFLENGLNKYNN